MVSRVCGEAMRKAEAHSELNLARDVKGFVRWWLSTCSALLLAMPHPCGYGLQAGVLGRQELLPGTLPEGSPSGATREPSNHPHRTALPPHGEARSLRSGEKVSPQH